MYSLDSIKYTVHKTKVFFKSFSCSFGSNLMKFIFLSRLCMSVFVIMFLTLMTVIQTYKIIEKSYL